VQRKPTKESSGRKVSGEIACRAQAKDRDRQAVIEEVEAGWGKRKLFEDHATEHGWSKDHHAGLLNYGRVGANKTTLVGHAHEWNYKSNTPRNMGSSLVSLLIIETIKKTTCTRRSPRLGRAGGTKGRDAWQLALLPA